MRTEDALDITATVERMEQLAESALSSNPPRTIALHFRDAARHLRRLLAENERLRLTLATAALPLEAMVAGGTDALHSAHVQAAIREGITAVRKALSDA